MPATKFICPDGSSVTVLKCLNKCPRIERCMFLPTLRAVAASLDRKLPKATVTELLCGTRETYLKKTTEYAVNPQQQIYAMAPLYILSMKRIRKAICLAKNVLLMR